MKKEGLMVGDWVEVTNSDHLKYVQVGAVFTDLILTQEAEYESEEIDIKDLQPIPLTKEILLNNGFEEFCEGCIVKELSDDEIPTLYVWNGSIKSLYVVDNYSTNKYTYVKECKYVHEFQHELKSCGIKKEIVL